MKYYFIDWLETSFEWGQSMKKLIAASIICILIPSSAFGYNAPKGIPNPSNYFSNFGEIDQATPNPATKCPNWPSAATASCYYVDKTSGAATDSANTYGYPSKPRLTIPDLSGLAAGSFVYVHAGTYTQTLTINGNGTASNPIWFTGNPSARPTLDRAVQVGLGANASYIVVENFNLTGAYGFVDIRPATSGITIRNIILRYLNFTGTQAETDPGPIMLGANYNGSSTSYIVAYKNTMADYGNKNPDASQDVCGIYASEYTSYIWALENTISGMGADGIAGCHNCVPGNQPQYYFIGKNTIYGGGENCIDLKGVQNFIISENICYGPFAREQGWGIVIHVKDGTQNDPLNGWIIFNKLYHLSSAIAFTTGLNHDMYVVGNLIYDIHASYAAQADPAYNGRGVLAAGVSGNLWIVDNTFYNYDEGITVSSNLSGTDSVKIHGNILAGRTDTTKYEVNITTNAAQAYVQMKYNLFYGPSGTSSFYWAGATRNFFNIDCANCKDARSPLFVAAPANLQLQATSPARDASVEGPIGGTTVYNTFFNTWGMSIKKDYTGNSRPQGSAWDIGAYEYPASGAPLSPPANFRTQ